jgi:prevent-host-death family protein
MDMKTVSVAVLKQQLSRYLHQVEDGEDVVVTAHSRPVARVTSVVPGSLRIRKPTANLSVLHRLKGVTLSPGRTAVDLLIEDRADR